MPRAGWHDHSDCHWWHGRGYVPRAQQVDLRSRARVSARDYSEEWTETTPQAMLEWKISDTLFTYFTYSEGFKGGGFDDTPANIPQAITPFDPESAKNYELGIKSDLFDRRLRINADVFTMDYTNLQVTQTNAACLCNLTDNAASAKIKGVEAEFDACCHRRPAIFTVGLVRRCQVRGLHRVCDQPDDGPALDSSGNRLQRTPETQVERRGSTTRCISARGAGRSNFRANYTWQSDMFWATDNIAKEPSYGLRRCAHRAIAGRRALGSGHLGQEPDRRTVSREHHLVLR